MIFSMLKYTLFYPGIFVINWVRKKILFNIIIIISCLRCQIAVIYLHSWTEKWDFSAWLISDFPVSRLKFGYKKVNSDLNCQINNSKIFSFQQVLEDFSAIYAFSFLWEAVQ